MERKGLSGSAIKMIAIITMFIDHVGATVIARFLIVGADASQCSWAAWLTDQGMIWPVYRIMRNIGRIAFPIYCFLLVEGFVHTGNRRKYALRLGMFALLSEVPFDLAFNAAILEFRYQNVFFTLFLGMLTMMACQWAEEQTKWNLALRVLLMMAAASAGMAAAELLATDYGAIGVFCILMLYMFRKNRMWQVLIGCLSFFWWELPALFAFIPIACYNGKRGWKMKYFFYIFYPAHLLLLYAICCWYRVADVAVV